MTLKNRVVISLGIGALVTAVGWGLSVLSGSGPGGPRGILGWVAYVLLIFPIWSLQSWFPPGVIGPAVAFVVPTLAWGFVAFCLSGLWS